MNIKRYCKAYEIQLFDMLKEEGEDWKDYHGPEGHDKYLKALGLLCLIILDCIVTILLD